METMIFVIFLKCNYLFVLVFEKILEKSIIIIN